MGGATLYHIYNAMFSMDPFHAMPVPRNAQKRYRRWWSECQGAATLVSFFWEYMYIIYLVDNGG